MAGHAKPGARDVDQLPKEMHDMKIRDDKVDTGDDKVRTCLSSRAQVYGRFSVAHHRPLIFLGGYRNLRPLWLMGTALRLDT